MTLDLASFTPAGALAGGALIGLAATLLLLLAGRVAGVSGIAGGLMRMPLANDAVWRLLFVLGLVAGGFLGLVLGWGPDALRVSENPLMLAAGGLLVGFGTRLGRGCTSGHGVCGLARFSRRSAAATAIFMVAAAASVFVARHLEGVVMRVLA